MNHDETLKKADVAFRLYIKPVLEDLDKLSVVLGTVCEIKWPHYCSEPFLHCQTYLDERELERCRSDGRCGDNLHHADRLLRKAGYQSNLHASAHSYYDWCVYSIKDKS